MIYTGKQHSRGLGAAMVLGLALTIMAAGIARAAEVTDDFTTASNTKIAPDPQSSSVGLVDINNATFDWGAWNNAAPESDGFTEVRTINNHLQFQCRDFSPQGSYLFTKFSTGGASPLVLAAILFSTKDDPDAGVRMLVRDSIGNGSNNAWYASERVDLDSLVDVANTDWYLVTNGGAEMNAGDTGIGTFVPLTFDATAKTWAQTGISAIDAAGVYCYEDYAGNFIDITHISWSGTVPSLVTVPDVIGLTTPTATTSLTAVGLGYDWDTSNQWSDVVLPGQVSNQDPLAGTDVVSGTIVTLREALGPRQLWLWNGNAGGGEFANGGNWEINGVHLPDDPWLALATWQSGNLDEHRLFIASADTATLDTGGTTITARNLSIKDGGKIVVNNGVLYAPYGGSAIGSVQIAVPYPAGSVVTTGTMEVNGGAVMLRTLAIGETNARNPYVGVGTMKVTGGAVTIGEHPLDNTRDLSIGNAAGRGGPGVGTLELHGSALSFRVDQHVQMESPHSTLRFVADSAGFPQITLGAGGSRGNVDLTSGAIEIDASAIDVGLTPGPWTLLTGPGVVNDGNGLLANADITAPLDTFEAGWSLSAVGGDVVLSYVIPPAECSLSTTTLDFGTTSDGVAVARELVITNTGGRELGLYTLERSAGDDGVFSAPGFAATSITAQTSATVTLEFLATEGGAYAATYALGCNTGSYDLFLSGSAITSIPVCLVTPSLLSFGMVATTGSLTKSFTITNDGSPDLVVTSMTLAATVDGDPAYFDILTAFPLASIAYGTTAGVQVSFTPTSVTVTEAQYLIDCASPALDVLYTLKGWTPGAELPPASSIEAWRRY